MTPFSCIKLYISDYLAYTARLKTLEHGAYILLIFNYLQTGKALKNNNFILSSIARCSYKEWLSVKEFVLKFFEERDGLLYPKRVEEYFAD